MQLINGFGLMLKTGPPAGELSRGIEFGFTQPLQTMRQLIVKQLDYDLMPVADSVG